MIRARMRESERKGERERKKRKGNERKGEETEKREIK